MIRKARSRYHYLWKNLLIFRELYTQLQIRYKFRCERQKLIEEAKKLGLAVEF